MRILMWFTIGFGFSSILGGYGIVARGILPAAIGAAMLGAICLIAGKRWKPAKIAAVIALGCAVGLGWFAGFRQYYLEPAAQLDEQKCQVDFTASDYGCPTEYGTRVDAMMELNGGTYRVRLYLDDEKTVAPGDRICGQFYFRFTAAGAGEETTYHPGKGIFLLAYQEEEVLIVPEENRSWYHGPAILARKIGTMLEAAFPEDTLGFARALLLGDTSGLDYETDTHLKLSGIRHVVAVSGLHVSILFGLLTVVTFRRRYLTALLGFPALFLFAALAGFTPSVTRACIMSGLMLLSQLLDREYDGATALSFASLVMLGANPLVITSVSFQLSVASVAGIFLFQPRIQNWFQTVFGNRKGWYIRWFTGSVSVSLSATVLTTPLSAIHFGAVSLIGTVTNLLTLWMISLIFYGIMGICGMSLLWAPAASLMARGISWLIRAVLGISGFLGGLPVSAIYSCSIYVVSWLVFCYILLAVFAFSKNRSPAALACCAAVGLCVSLLASWLEPATDEFRMTVLDVGQGQSILLQSEGRYYLVDCGGDSDTETADIVSETLLSQGVDRLDGIILTHLDRDHAGALSNLLTRIDADVVIVPDVPAAAKCQLEEKGIHLDRDTVISWGNTKITIYGPNFYEDSNENCLCILLQTQNCDILITGDRSDFGERMLIRNADLPDVDVLIAGHHGSGNSTSEDLLNAVTPETVIISVGENAYGHPAKSLLQRLEKYGCSVFRTDLHGTIIYRR